MREPSMEDRGRFLRCALRQSLAGLISVGLAVRLAIVLAPVAASTALSHAQAPSSTASGASGCALTQSDKAANAALSVPDFDYLPSTPSTARALHERGCYAAAAEAGEDYLIRGKVDSERNHSNIIFHIGQNLAKSGDERGAARIIAAAKRPSQVPGASFDWNTYVIGTWAFMSRDRVLLQSAYDTLKSQPGEGNQTNAKVLGGLVNCYGQPYSLAYSPQCQNVGGGSVAPAQ